VAPHAEQLVPGHFNRESAAEHPLGRHFSQRHILFVLTGLFLLWRTAHRRHLHWSTKQLVGTMLLGFGIFNFVEGVVDHHWLGIHHVNETVPNEQWHLWDYAFTASGLIMIAAGSMVYRLGKQESPQ
jgi:uncharacterized membrane protein